MTSSMEEHSLKRKISSGGERSIYLLFHSVWSKKAAALYEVKIMTSIKEGEEVHNLIGKDNNLTEVVTLYDQNRDNRVLYAACTPFGNHSLLFLPNEFDPLYDCHPSLPKRDFTRLNPRVFNLLIKKPDTKEAAFKPPSGRKFCPIAVTLMVGGDNYKKKKQKKIYVLSQRHGLLTDPSFEAYDMVSKNWEILPKPLFTNDFPADSSWGWTTKGYAVFQDFLVFCIHNEQAERPTHEIWSYNTLTRKWKRVSFTTTPLVDTLDDSYALRSFRANDDDDADDEEHHSEFRMWVGQAVVIDSFIYGYVPRLGTLVSFSCSKVSRGNEYDLSLGDKIIMERIDRLRDWKPWHDLEHGNMRRTGVVGQIGDDLICLVRTIFSNNHGLPNLQPVYIKTFRILPGGHFTGVQPFYLYMPRSEQFHYGKLASCFTV